MSIVHVYHVHVQRSNGNPFLKGTRIIGLLTIKYKLLTQNSVVIINLICGENYNNVVRYYWCYGHSTTATCRPILNTSPTVLSCATAYFIQQSVHFQCMSYTYRLMLLLLLLPMRLRRKIIRDTYPNHQGDYRRPVKLNTFSR